MQSNPRLTLVGSWRERQVCRELGLRNSSWRNWRHAVSTANRRARGGAAGQVADYYEPVEPMWCDSPGDAVVKGE